MGDPAGANGLLVLPYFSGERTPFTDPLARGMIVGLTLQHIKADLRRAILEGIGFGVRHLLEAFAQAGIPVEAIRAAGGATRDPIGLRLGCAHVATRQPTPSREPGAGP